MTRARRSDGDITRTKILETAGKLIAKNGYAQTSSKAVSQAAGVDLASINYHFGGREGLYLAVLSAAHKHFMDGSELKALVESGLPPEEKFCTFIDMLVHRVKSGADWHSLVFFREIFSPSVTLTNFIESEGMEKIAGVRKIICEVTLLPEDNPGSLLCMLSVIAPCLMLMVAGKRLPGPIRTISALEDQIIAEHFKCFALAGMKAVAAQIKSSC
ncbi:CerR family C-terminal domain-containing protein [Citrobacter amalonaticus]|nr:CerR family C-terminal domain-containing protein [Citrobacter amalonaticus]